MGVVVALAPLGETPAWLIRDITSCWVSFMAVILASCWEVMLPLIWSTTAFISCAAAVLLVESSCKVCQSGSSWLACSALTARSVSSSLNVPTSSCVAPDSGAVFPPGPFWAWAVVALLQAANTDSMARMVSTKIDFFILFSLIGSLGF